MGRKTSAVLGGGAALGVVFVLLFAHGVWNEMRNGSAAAIRPEAGGGDGRGDVEGNSGGVARITDPARSTDAASGDDAVTVISEPSAQSAAVDENMVIPEGVSPDADQTIAGAPTPTDSDAAQTSVPAPEPEAATPAFEATASATPPEPDAAQTPSATPEPPAAPDGTALANLAPLPGGAPTTADRTPVAPPADPPSGPALDLVRVDAAGAAVLAGRAPAGGTVTLRLDGAAVGRAQADLSGNFVAFLDLPPSEAPQVLAIESEDADGRFLQGAESIIIAPAAPTAAVIPEAPEIDTAADGALDGALDGAKSAGVLNDAPEPVRPGEAFASAPLPQVSPEGSARVDPLVEPSSRPDVPGVDAKPALRPEPPPTITSAAPLAIDAPGDPSAGSPAALSDAPLGASREGAQPQAPDALTAGISPGGDGSSAVEPDTPMSPSAATAGPAELRPSATTSRTDPPPAAPGGDALASAAPAPPAAPRLFRAGPAGIRLETAAERPPEAAESLGLDAIAYDEGGAVQLAGRGDAGTALRVYLDGRPVRDVAVGPDGAWASPLPKVDEGVYTLRIDALGADGTVVGRLETPFERTAPAVAAAARREGRRAITVQPGYTLWALSEGYFGEGTQYVQIYEANRGLIRDPDLIYPGQVFALPQVEGAEPSGAAEAAAD
ncbi:LysM peptidoglycan-binding domain-containing protein [Jannaschia sp. W003]|uniref:LysM peptidoglycan-binding domain-containing protein n=1 Tax=Jannaschia sp. W003 TaxID=2867012 RepID=UPI0021A2F19D|nr:LysM peptidoglycan-binding domain-containing protein [Jannaschia sp. W003]UWQ20508.1 LysM peptidoglycan-binding domain-containing protein [Jannaschia sp. W003]